MPDDDFLNDEQKMVRRMTRDFCEREIAPRAAEIDEGRFPAEVVKSMGELGLMGLTVPDSYGGGGADPVSMALATEEGRRRVSFDERDFRRAQLPWSVNPSIASGARGRRKNSYAAWLRARASALSP